MKTVVFNPISQCIGKAKHPDRGAAIAQARKTGDSSIQEYRCPHCGAWHVGHAVPWVAKRMFYGIRIRPKPRRCRMVA
jgi:hypothetical protein